MKRIVSSMSLNKQNANLLLFIYFVLKFNKGLKVEFSGLSLSQKLIRQNFSVTPLICNAVGCLHERLLFLSLLGLYSADKKRVFTFLILILTFITLLRRDIAALATRIQV